MANQFSITGTLYTNISSSSYDYLLETETIAPSNSYVADGFTLPAGGLNSNKEYIVDLLVKSDSTGGSSSIAHSIELVSLPFDPTDSGAGEVVLNVVVDGQHNLSNPSVATVNSSKTIR